MTTDEFHQKAQEIWDVIQNSQNILLSLHLRPDPDSVGSNLAFYHFLKKIGKNPKVISGDDKKPSKLDFLPGWDFIEDKSFYDLDLSQFDLFITLDDRDFSKIETKKNLVYPKDISTIVIDHHKTDSTFGKLKLVDSDSTSTCEMIWKFFESINFRDINKEIATCIYTGVYSDTAEFYTVNSSETFRVCSECLKYGVETRKILSAIKGLNLNTLKFIGKKYIDIITTENNKVAYIKFTYKEFKDYLIPDNMIGDIKDMILRQFTYSNETVLEAALYEYSPNEVSISLRSTHTDGRSVDVSKIAEYLNGGGHSYAAAAKYEGNIDDAEIAFKNALASVYPDLKPT